jgi:hypothetical protein
VADYFDLESMVGGDGQTVKLRGARALTRQVDPKIKGEMENFFS